MLEQRGFVMLMVIFIGFLSAKALLYPKQTCFFQLIRRNSEEGNEGRYFTKGGETFL